MKTFVGIDVSKASVDVAYPHGQRFKHLHFPHNDALTAAVILEQLPTQDVHMVMESTGTYNLHLATAFQNAGVAVSVINPLCIKYFSKMKLRRAKTDRIDARTIAQYGAAEQPPLWRPKAPEQEQLRQVVKAIEDLQSVRTSLTNRQEAAAFLPVQSNVCQTALEQLVAQVDAQLARLEAEMVRLARVAQREAYDLLLTVKGIGEKTASALVALCGNFSTFETAGQVVAFAGLNPSPCQSGTSVRGRGGISKRGHAILRKLLYMGAGSAAQHNPACRALSERLKAQGKPKQLVRVAVAQKLLRQAFGVVKGGQPFDPQYAR